MMQKDLETLSNSVFNIFNSNPIYVEELSGYGDTVRPGDSVIIYCEGSGEYMFGPNLPIVISHIFHYGDYKYRMKYSDGKEILVEGGNMFGCPPWKRIFSVIK